MSSEYTCLISTANVLSLENGTPEVNTSPTCTFCTLAQLRHTCMPHKQTFID